MGKLTGKQREFARQYVLLDNATAAYRVAYRTENMAEPTIGNAAHLLLKDPDIARFVAERRERAAFAFEVTEAMVLKLWWEIATADVNQLMRHRALCCRFCFGDGFRYQWRDPDEWAETMAAELAVADRQERDPKLIDDSGGYGYVRTLPPHPKCPRCNGEGVNDVWVADTDSLEGAARTLYAGVKQTRHGLEIRTRDQDAAAANIARYLGMFHDRAPGASNGNPIPPGVTVTAKTPAEAAKFYREMMG